MKKSPSHRWLRLDIAAILIVASTVGGWLYPNRPVPPGPLWPRPYCAAQKHPGNPRRLFHRSRRALLTFPGPKTDRPTLRPSSPSAGRANVARLIRRPRNPTKSCAFVAPRWYACRFLACTIADLSGVLAPFLSRVPACGKRMLVLSPPWIGLSGAPALRRFPGLPRAG